jgi:hypothetical protein
MKTFLVGVLAGLFNRSWFGVLVSSLVWGYSVCVFLSIFDTDYVSARIAWLEAHPRLWLRPPRLAFYIVEFSSAATSCLLVGTIAFAALLIFR